MSALWIRIILFVYNVHRLVSLTRLSF